MANSFCRDSFRHDGCDYEFVSLRKTADYFGGNDLSHLPYSIRILIENMVRHVGADGCSMAEIDAMVHRRATSFSFRPARALLQDLLGIPLLIDFAAMRDAAASHGIDPATINRSFPLT